MPRTPGLKATLQELTWKGHTLDVIRQETTEAPAYVVFGIQYPLSGEAVQLQVGGPIADEAGISNDSARSHPASITPCRW